MEQTLKEKEQTGQQVVEYGITDTALAGYGLWPYCKLDAGEQVSQMELI